MITREGKIPPPPAPVEGLWELYCCAHGNPWICESVGASWERAYKYMFGEIGGDTIALRCLIRNVETGRIFGRIGYEDYVEYTSSSLHKQTLESEK